MMETADGLTGRRAKAKGWYDKETGKITVVLGNHASPGDAVMTVIHEGVAHYGLRKLFGGHFDTFLDNVFLNADEEVRRAIVQMAAKHGWNFRTATEEYLANLAEDTDFERAMQQGWWQRIKKLFLDMLHDIGLANGHVGELSDNELRYILWHSYVNLTEPGSRRDIFGEAQDIARRYALKVGDYAVLPEPSADEAADGVEEPKPVGHGLFGDVYDQFRGKPKEAVRFLLNKQSGYLRGVFHRHDIGDIGLVWGDKSGGLYHIVEKHILQHDDFESVDDAAQTIESVIHNGVISRENPDKVVIDYKDHRVAVRKQTRNSQGDVMERENWVVTAFDKSRGEKEKTPSEKTLTTPPFNHEADGVTLPSNGISAANIGNVPESSKENDDNLLLRGDESESEMERTAREIYEAAVKDSGERTMLGCVKVFLKQKGTKKAINFTVDRSKSSIGISFL